VYAFETAVEHRTDEAGALLSARRRKPTQFRDPEKTLDDFVFNSNKKMNGSVVFDMAHRRLHRPAMKMPCFSVRPPGTSPQLRNWPDIEDALTVL
jgi:hypothetical protein